MMRVRCKDELLPAERWTKKRFQRITEGRGIRLSFQHF